MVGPECRGPGTSPGLVDTATNLILPAGDVRTELAALKENLRRSLEVVEARERELAAAAEPSPLEELDRLREYLLDAVAEVAERRAQLRADEAGGAGSR